MFVAAGKIWWLQAGVMLVGTVAGGYLGAHYARRIDQRYIRIAVIAISVAMTVLFFARRG
jgi:uncharacterized membrane protein YfcA